MPVTAGRTIMIVGNGDIPVGCAPAIDASDLVIRFNECRSFGMGGTRTDVVAVCNTGRPALAMLGGGRWKSKPPVVGAREIWCTREAARFEAMRPLLAARHPDLDDFCDDYTDGFAIFAAVTGRSIRSLGAQVHAAVDAALGAFEPEPYVVPSSGMLVIADVLAHRADRNDRVVLAGFGHQGWLWHPFDAERRTVERLIAEGRLSRLHP